jgi:hypothetical protein
LSVPSHLLLIDAMAPAIIPHVVDLLVAAHHLLQLLSLFVPVPNAPIVHLFCCFFSVVSFVPSFQRVACHRRSIACH